jgi:hypothetical protein
MITNKVPLNPDKATKKGRREAEMPIEDRFIT